MDLGLVAIGVILIVIVGAIKTRKCIEFMILGGILSSIILFGFNFVTEWAYVFMDVMYAEDSVWLVLVCCLFGSLIALLQESRGTFGFATIISKFCNTERKTLLTSFVLGILIFVDDYLNVLSIGVCMRNVYDKNKLPRESLAYMLDSTGAPVCTILPFSTWAVFFGSLFFAQQSVQELGFATATDTYLATIPFTFYPLFTLVVTFLFATGVLPKLGGMKKAYKRVNDTGEVYSSFSRKYNHDEEDNTDFSGNILDFIIPIGILIAIAVVTGDLLLAVIIDILVCFVIYVPRKVIRLDNFINIVIKGFGDMLPTIAIVLMGYILENFLSQMGLTEYIIKVTSQFLTPELLPAIIFILVAVLTFTTGSNWGMSAVCIPIVFPLAAAVDANIILTMASILSGAAFGSHACFYSDTTLLASSSCKIDNIEHAASQIPYVIISCTLTIIAFVIAGFIMV